MGYFGLFDKDGTPKCFFHDSVNEIPVDAVPLTDEQWAELVGNQDTRRFIGGKVVEVAPDAPSLDATKAAAKASLSSLLDAAASSLTSGIPLAEQLSWTNKQAAARAYLAGEAREEQQIILQSEAGVTGESLDTLCKVIIDSADAYAASAGRIAGLRRKVSDAIDECPDVSCVAAAMKQSEQTIKAAVLV